MSSREQDRLRLVTEVALAVVTATAVLGMHRLFADGSYRGPLLLQVALAHTCVALLRRARLRLALAGLVTAAAGLIAIAITQYLSVSWLGLPSPETFSAIQNDIDSAWSVFRDVQAPAPVEPGFVVTTSIAIWVIAFIADWGAFRTGVSFEALLPPATLFLFAAVLGAEGGRAGGAALFVAASLVFVLLHRTWRQNRVGAWAMIQQRRGRWSVVVMGSTLSCVAVIVAGIGGPLLPGADDPGIIPWQDIGDEDETRTVISPLVEIQARMLDQPDAQVFTVRSDPPGGAYWRITALDDFDGNIWKSAYETDDADGELPSAIESAEVATETITQQISIQALARIWLPAAYEPSAISAEGAEVGYDEDSGTLIVDEETENSDGLEYTVESRAPNWRPEQLRAAPTELSEEMDERYTRLPEGFSQRVRDEAVNLTADQATPYDKAVALMTYLREEFEYDTNVGSGHDTNAIERFLFETRRGYCEQFAGTYAAMMRALDIPARVVVGFTQGDPDPNEPGLYRVKGKHAHAWTEIYFPTYGWVTFDPTPTRGPPGGAAWLPGVQEQQANTPPAEGGSSTTTPAGEPGGPSRPPGETGDRPTPEVGTEGVEVRSNEEDETGFSRFVPEEIEPAIEPIAVTAVLYVLVVPVAIAVAHQVRRRRARNPMAKVRFGWQEVDEQLTAAGLRLDPSLTVAERAAVMRRALPEMAQNIELLARAMEQVAYAEAPPSPDQVERVEEATAQVTAAARSRRPKWRRALAYLDARRLLPRPHPDDARPQSDEAPAAAPA